MIAKGVRFNADKKEVGKFHSTKILEFKLIHHCGNIMICRTDPEHGDYIFTEGARRWVI